MPIDVMPSAQRRARLESYSGGRTRGQSAGASRPQSVWGKPDHITSPPVTRWLLLLFVFLLPAQFAWSAAAMYCEHETAPTAFHLGHHAHQHKDADPGAADTAATAPAADDTLPVPHADCSYCHASVAQLPIGLVNLFDGPQRHSFTRPPRQPYVSRIDPDIDRPKWTRAS